MLKHLVRHKLGKVYFRKSTVFHCSQSTAEPLSQSCGFVCFCYSQTEIEEALNAVRHGPFYLSRLVETADKLLEEKAASNK